MYSHLLRTSIANGWSDPRFFLIDNLQPESKRPFIKLRYDCNRPGMIIGSGLDYILDSSLIKGFVPLRSREAISMFVRGISTVSGLIDFPSLTTEIRRCPKCWAEAKEHYGEPYIMLDHLMPVSVCPVHGCSLERYVGPLGKELSDNAQYVPCEVQPFARETSSFCHGLLESDLQCSLQDVSAAVIQTVGNRYGMRMTDRRLYAAIDKGTGVKGAGAALGKIGHPSSSIATDRLIPVLAHLFGDVKTMASMVSSTSLREKFDKASVSHFRLVGPWREDIISARCLDCGSTVITTPHAVITGIGCPVCTANLTEPELIERQIRSFGNEARILTPIRGYRLPVTLDTGSGPYMTTPERFISYDDLSSTDTRPGVVTEPEIAKDIESEGRFEYVSSRRVNGQILLHVHDSICGKDFEVFRNNFLLNRRCRCCQDVRFDDKWFASKVTRVSEGRWELVGGYDRMQKPVTVKEISTGITKTGRADRILKALEPKKTKKDREADRIAIDARIRELSGSVMCLGDFHDITDRRYVCNYINRLRTSGVLKPLATGFFCEAGKEFSALDVADAKYVMHNGIRFGLHIGNTFLRDIGFDVEDQQPCVVTSRTSVQQWTRTETIMGKEFRIMFSPVTVTDTNWKVLTLMLFYDHLNECTLAVNGSKVADALRLWADDNGLVSDDFRPFCSYFPDAVMNSIVGIIRRAS